MNIGFEAKRLFQNDRGLGNYARNLVNGLLQYETNNHYFLYAPKAKTDYLDEGFLDNPKIHVRTPKGAYNVFSSYWRTFAMGKDLSSDKLDIFHGLSHEIPANVAKSTAKVVVTVHDLIFVKHPEFYNPVDRWIYYKKLEHAVRTADRVIAVSEQTRRDIVKEFSLPSGHVDVIYQSCHEAYYSKRTKEEKDNIRIKLKLPPKYILYVGALNENKNVKVILEALQKRKSTSELNLVIVGKGKAYRKKLEYYAEQHNLIDRIHFISDSFEPTPYVLSALYQMAAAFVFPSFYEGFGIPILEARASAIPVIASNSSCLEEVGGEGSHYFEPSDAGHLATLINQLELGSLSFDSAPPMKFHARTLTAQLIKLYSSLL